MESRDLKKFVAGFGIVGLLAGAGLLLGGHLKKAEAS
jgi:radical SAM modification target selenobiotic family peptide